MLFHNVGVFILYLCNTANEFCKKSKRQTLSADDVMNAIEELELDELLQPLAMFLKKFRSTKKVCVERRLFGRRASVDVYPFLLPVSRASVDSFHGCFIFYIFVVSLVL